MSAPKEQAGWVEVRDVDALPPFLISVVSPSDHWLYASSSGGLSAGRVNAEGSLFPYITDDKLHRAGDDQGPWTCLRVRRPDGVVTTWEPFRPRNDGGVRRGLRKSVAGDRLVFEETHLALGLRFAYRWAFSERCGFVRTCTLSHTDGDEPLSVEIVDGLQGLLPANAPLSLTQTGSCLVDAYTRAEWLPSRQLALVTLEAQPSDRAAPAESLRATVAWCEGLHDYSVLLSRRQLDAIALGAAPRAESLVTGRPGAFLVAADIELAPGEARTWHIVADVDRSHADIAALGRRDAELEADIRESTATLDGIMADVDGLQRTADATLDAHHRANALFNTMRGGLPLDEHRISVDQLAAFVEARSRPCFARSAAWFAARAGQTLERGELVEAAAGDPDLARLAGELMPLWFGRRHGDPSRPWNQFSIRLRDGDGRRRLAWQGNWRDVFQNWEALLLSYPEFIEGAVSLFVNASTRDGHNPYRITSEGVDWERPDPHDPWANIGYWGDHQVSYLTRLLELSVAHHPGRLGAMLDQEIFSFADVPYRLRPYAELLADPRESIAFDEEADQAVAEREARIGADGRLLLEGEGVLHVNLAEKLLVPVLAKLCDLVPGAGIWMNTQRPEWNDANNALAGFGVSVVTAAYLRRHVVLLQGLLRGREGALRLTAAAATWADEVRATLLDEPPTDPRGRRAALDALGESYGRYRALAYAGGGLERVERPAAALLELLSRAQVWLEQALSAARRPDGLFDGYDLLKLSEGRVEVERLYPMLEGQVAVLASGVLSAEEAAALLERMVEGPLYRPDVDSFMLYPARALPSFMEKNRVPERAADLLFVQALFAAGDRSLIVRDGDGALRFAPDFSEAGDVEAVLTALDASPEAREAVMALWEQTFDHHAFTGRSGTMYAYEGLGSVYWHMVGKLLLAVQETAARAAEADGGSPRLDALYRRVREGLGWRRSPHEHGAIPTDPHSHTPMGRGAQQPGMTGIVKEELVTRRGELGVVVADGRLSFRPERIEASELLPEAQRWSIPAGVRPARELWVPEGGLGFLLCGVPVVVRPGEDREVAVELKRGARRFEDGRLDAETSALIFRRDPRVQRILVNRPKIDS